MKKKNDRLKKLTAVDNLEASVISRFPFKPRRAGTRI